MTIAKSQLERESTANQPSWPACFAMLVAWIVQLLEQITKLKKVRHHTRFKPGWQSHWPDLRQAEWHRDQLLAAGAAQVLAGKDIDSTECDLIMDPPAGYGGDCPRTPFEMNRRFLAIAEWLRDPHTLIRRHAACILRRAASPLRRATRATSPGSAGGELGEVLPRRSRGRWRAASSRRDGGCASPRGPPQGSHSANHHPHPESPRFRERARASS